MARRSSGSGVGLRWGITMCEQEASIQIVPTPHLG
jgi:hypothetical protein